MTDRLIVTVENDVYKGDYAVKEIEIKEHLEGHPTLITFKEDGTMRIHQLDDVKNISVE